MRPIVVAALILFAIVLPASAAESNWVCGPGESVQAEAVPGGLEVTAVPDGAVRLRFRSSSDVAGHGQRSVSVYADGNDVPVFFPAPDGLPFVQVLAKGPWEAGNPYPSVGCPTERLAQ